MDWDEWLSQQFVDGLNKATGSKYNLRRRPDKETRHEAEPKKAVEAIYDDLANGSLAIEHTRVEAFDGMLDYENKVFSDVWEPLKGLPLAEHHVWIRVPFEWLAKDSHRRSRHKAGGLVRQWWLGVILFT